MKSVVLAYVSVLCLVGFVLVCVTMINTGSAGLIGRAVALIIASLVCALIVRRDYERGKRKGI